MDIIILTDNTLEMTPNCNDISDFKAANIRDANDIDGLNYDLLSGMLVDPMGNGKDYELAPPEEFRKTEGFVISDGEYAWHYCKNDLFEKLRSGETTIWKPISIYANSFMFLRL